jgi:hypothetical protein
MAFDPVTAEADLNVRVSLDADITQDMLLFATIMRVSGYGLERNSAFSLEAYTSTRGVAITIVL